MSLSTNSSLEHQAQNHTDIYDSMSCPLVKSHMWYLEYLRGVYIVCCILHSIFAITAVLGNSLVLYAILKTPSLHKPSMMLICNLAITDMAVGLLVQPLYVIYKASELSGLVAVSCYTGVVTNMLANLFSGVSFLTVTLISLDRYLALHLHLRYPAVVTTNRVLKAIGASWIGLAIFVSFYPWKISISLFAGIALVPVCLVVTSFTFFKIHSIVRKHRKQVAVQSLDNQSVGLPTAEENSNAVSFRGLNLSKYWKSVITMSYVYMLLVLCFLPYMFTLGTRVVIGLTKEYKLALNITTSIIYINSSINPFLYCYRLREVRNAVLKIFGKGSSSFEASRSFNLPPTRSSRITNTNIELSNSNKINSAFDNT